MEPFAGGAIIGLSALFENRIDKLTLVELDADVASLWGVLLSDSGPELAAAVAEFNPTAESISDLTSREHRTTRDRAFATIVMNRVRRGGILAPGAGLIKRGENGAGLLSRWYPDTLLKRMMAIWNIRDRIQFVHGDGIQAITENARRTDVIYFIDPPYSVAGKRLYLHGEVDHAHLFDIASAVSGDVLMTYDNSNEMREFARAHGFDTRLALMKNTHHGQKSELLIGRNFTWMDS
jgi:DNA adenine methylase